MPRAVCSCSFPLTWVCFAFGNGTSSPQEELSLFPCSSHPPAVGDLLGFCLASKQWHGSEYTFFVFDMHLLWGTLLCDSHCKSICLKEVLGIAANTPCGLEESRHWKSCFILIQIAWIAQLYLLLWTFFFSFKLWSNRLEWTCPVIQRVYKHTSGISCSNTFGV